MTGQYSHIVRQRQQFFADSRDEGFVVPARQIPAADTAGKKHIPAHESPLGGEMDAQASRAVARHMEDAAGFAKEVMVTFEQEFVRSHGIDVQCKSPSTEKFGVRDHGLGERVHGDRTAMAVLDRSRICHVIEVAVRQD